MSSITYTVTAQTGQAQAEMQKFFKDVQTGLRGNVIAANAANQSMAELQEQLHTLRHTSLLSREAMHELEIGALALGGASFPQLFRGAQAARLGINLVRTASILTGLSVAAMGATVVAVAAVVLTFGIPALAAYKAKLEETKTAAELLAEIQTLIHRNSKLLDEAKQKHLISKEDFDYITALLKLGTMSGLKGAQDEMKKLGITTEGMQAMEKFIRLKKEMESKGLGEGPEAEAARALASYKDKLQEIQQLAENNPAIKALQPDAEAAAKAEYDAKMASINRINIKEAEASELKKLDDQVTQYEIDNSNKTVGKAQEEFGIRAALYYHLYETETITLDRFHELWNAANLKRIEGIKSEEEERARLIESMIRKRQEELDLIRQQIRADFTLTEVEKYRQLQSLGDTKHQLGPDPRSWSQQFQATFVDLQNAWGTWATQAAGAFKSVFESAISSISNGIMSLIEGTKTWGQALRQIGVSILTTIVNAIVQMGVRWIATQLMMAIAGKAIAASATAATAPIAAAQAGIWAVPATLATIASYGAAAYSAPGQIALAEMLTTMGALTAREQGGPVEAGRPYIVGEKRAELFVPSTSGRILPSVPGRGAAGNGDTHVHAVFFDDRASMKDYIKSTAGKRVILKMINESRTDIGFNT